MNALFGFIVGLIVMFIVKDYIVKFVQSVINWFKKVFSAMFSKGE